MILTTSDLVGPALAELGRRHPVVRHPFRSDAWEAALPGARALLVMLSEPLTVADLDRAPRLRAIGTYSVGVNHLPLAECEARNIKIVNTPGTLTEATADLALALLLGVTRRLAEGEALVRGGTWKGWAPDQLLGIGLAGKTCGILGAGAIGRAFARRAWALGMQVAFWDREGHGGTVDFGPDRGPRRPLPDLLRASAVLSLHCPLTPATQGLLDASALALLPEGAVVVNTARGGILDESALMDGLDSGRLGGAGLDVYAGEPRLDPRWLRTPRTVLLPHLGSATTETRAAMAAQLCNGLREALEG